MLSAKRSSGDGEPQRGNSLTRWVVAHPIHFAIVTAALMAAWGLVSIGDLRAVIPMSLGIALVNWFIWRPSGPGARWALTSKEGSSGTD